MSLPARPESAISKLVPYLAFFAGLILSAMVVPSALETLDIALDIDAFESTEALVTTHRTQSHQRGPDTVIVEYEFTLNGDTVRGNNLMTRISDDPAEVDRLVRRVKGRDRIKVWYDPSNPRRSVIHEEVSVWRPLGMIALSLLLVLGGAHAYVIDKRRRALQKRADDARKKKEEERQNRAKGGS